MKKRELDFLLIGHNEDSLKISFKRFQKNICGNIIKLPVLNDVFDAKKRKIIEEFVVFENYESIILVCDPQNLDISFELLTYLTFLSNRCNVIVESNAITGSLKKFHSKNISKLFPFSKNILKSKYENQNFTDIKYPESITQAFNSLSNALSIDSDFHINPKFLTLKYMEEEDAFTDKFKNMYKIEIEKDFPRLKQNLTEKLEGKSLSYIHDKCLKLTAEFLLGKYYEICFSNLF